tara:strand:- start:6991 stop:7596 length:606 start_codon:yes stop_codon:yes gene_type:complete
MNNIIINEINKIIKKAESEKTQYFNFESKIKFQLENLKNRRRRISIYGYSKEQEEKHEEEVEDLEKKLSEMEEVINSNKEEVINSNKEELYKNNNISDNIYIKNKKLYFFNISISVNEDLLLLKSNEKMISVNFNKIFSFDVNENKITISYEKYENSIYFENFKKYIEKEVVNIYVVNDIKKYTTLFLEIIEIIILNKNIY